MTKSSKRSTAGLIAISAFWCVVIAIALTGGHTVYENGDYMRDHGEASSRTESAEPLREFFRLFVVMQTIVIFGILKGAEDR